MRREPGRGAGMSAILEVRALWLLTEAVFVYYII